jgi:hypothetical protein
LAMHEAPRCSIETLVGTLIRTLSSSCPALSRL